MNNTNTYDKPMNQQQLQQEIQKTQEQLQRLQSQLKEAQSVTIETAQPGDTLPDGCVVIERYEDSVLIAAPASTEVKSKWTPEFSEVFDSLKSQGFIPAQWYVPSLEELKLAYANCRSQFSSTLYWSSTEYSSTLACNVGFNFGGADCSTKAFSCCVRAFRRVVF